MPQRLRRRPGETGRIHPWGNAMLIPKFVPKNLDAQIAEMNCPGPRPVDAVDTLRAALTYDPATGDFTWLRRPGRGVRTDRVGQVAGAVNNTGYVAIQIGARKYLAHRLAWLYVHGEWPRSDLDHINGVRTDNSIANLRPASRTLNAENQRLREGSLGVDFHRASSRWRARITVDGDCRLLGYFASRIEAQEAYLHAKRQYHKGCTI